MDSPTDGRSSSDNPLLIGMVYQTENDEAVEVALGVVVVPGRSRVLVNGLRLGGGARTCRVIAAAAAGQVPVVLGEGVITVTTYFPGRLLVRDQDGTEFIAFADEVAVIGRRGRPSEYGKARLRVLVGDPLR